MASPSSLSVSQPTTYADTLCPPPAFHSIPGQAPVVIGLHYKRGPPRDGRLNLVCLSLVVDVLSETSRLSRIRRKTKRSRLLVSSRPIGIGRFQVVGPLQLFAWSATLSIIRGTWYVNRLVPTRAWKNTWTKTMKKKKEQRRKERGKWANEHADAWRSTIDFHFRSRKSRGCASSTLRRERSF